MALDRPALGWGPRMARLLAAFALDPPPVVRAGFEKYLDQVASWGARIDLTAARSADELVDLSLADAVVVAQHELSDLPGAAESRVDGGWVDVGSGGGAPGLPLAVLLCAEIPALRATLVEPRTKRVAFLRSSVGELGLEGVEVVRCRSDALPGKSFSRAIARATLPPPEWLAEGTRLAREAVWVLVAREEPPSQPGWSIDRDVRYCWPLTGAPRRALRYVPDTSP